MLILGIDAGIANCGWALVRATRNGEVLEDFGVVSTEKSDKKRHILVADDNVRRAREIYDDLVPLFDRDIKVVAIESQSIPRNASAAAKTAFCLGVVVALAAQHDLPIVQEGPKTIKKRLCGRGDASKTDVEAAVIKLFSGAPALVMQKGINKTEREHVFDAVAAIMACLPSETIRMGLMMEGEQG